MGMSMASAIRRSTANCSLESIKLASGMHFSEAEMAKPLAHTPSNPARSISLALSASWAPTIFTAPGRLNRALSLVA